MKKSLTILIVILTINSFIYSQSIGVGTNSPAASAALDVSSTSKGLLIPRMTSTQRSAIASPVNGLMVYDITTNSFWYYNGVAWTNTNNSGSSSGGPLVFPFDTTLALPGTAFRVWNTGTSIQGASTNGTGVLATSSLGAGLQASSANSYGIISTSTNNSAIYAYNNNISPAIDANNANGSGVAINGTSPNHHAIKGVSGGISKAGVWGEATGSGGNGIYGTSSGSQGYGVYGHSVAGTGLYGFSQLGTGVKAFSSTGLALDVSGNIKFSGSTSPAHGAVLTSDANGNASWKNNRIAFHLRGVNSSYTSLAPNYSTKIHWTNEIYDYGDDYLLHTGTNPTSDASTFTVPKTGIYHFDAKTDLVAFDGSEFTLVGLHLNYKRNGITNILTNGVASLNGSKAECLISCDMRLIAGDLIWAEVYQENSDESTAVLTSQGPYSYFNCHLLFEE
jgi:hypothetical protein